MTFAHFNLAQPILKALDSCGYKTPTPIQAKSIPEILLGNDVVASAQTGTGKTASFVLPALHNLASQKATPQPRVLILTPTRELASQITGAVEKYGKFLRVNIASLVGGMSYRQQLKSLSRPVDLIVATPGRLMDHMSNRRVDLSKIQMLILDEADRMLDMGFVDDVRAIAKQIPNDRQTLLFSATVDQRLNQVIRQLLKDPIKIDVSPEQLTPTQITQTLYMADSPQHKMRLFMHLLQDQAIFKAIIFSATKAHADKLASELVNAGYTAAALHGDLKQSVRTRTVEQLRRGKIQFLVATDVAARGIDIQDITHVINYDLPKFAEDYVHRIGRTGRAGKTGHALSLALPSDLRHIQRIERLMKLTLPRLTIAGMEPTKKARSSNGGKKKPFKKSSSGRYDHKQRPYAGKRSTEKKKPFSFGDKRRASTDEKKTSFAAPSSRRPFRQEDRDVKKKFTGGASSRSKDRFTDEKRASSTPSGRRPFRQEDGDMKKKFTGSPTRPKGKFADEKKGSSSSSSRRPFKQDERKVKKKFTDSSGRPKDNYFDKKPSGGKTARSPKKFRDS